MKIRSALLCGKQQKIDQVMSFHNYSERPENSLGNPPHGATKLRFIADRSDSRRFRDDLGLESGERRLQKRNGGRIRSAGDILINVLQLSSGDPVAHGTGIFDVF